MRKQEQTTETTQHQPYAAVADLLKVLADERRLRILALLIRRELCVCELVDILSLPQYEVSRHLGRLKKIGLVADRREGLWAYYSVPEMARRDPLRGGLLLFIEGQALANRDSDGDFARLEKRLALRQGSRCVVGFRD